MSTRPCRRPAAHLAAGYIALALAVPAAAQDAGKALYEANCAKCHHIGGTGEPPDFPALKGNDRLRDLHLIVTNIVRGKGAMPAFPDFAPDDIAAVASYVRRAWGNDFGVVETAEAEAVVAALAAAPPRVSVWEGVYSEAQAERGKGVHLAICARCHGPRLNGAGDPEMPPAPAIARAAFLRNWDGQSMATLFELVKTTMPSDNQGAFSDAEYVDAIAYILAVSGMPAGVAELPPDPAALDGIVIEDAPPNG